MSEAKDPDEFVIKYGNSRFNQLVDAGISLIEFKVKMLKSNLDLEHANDKIKFLNEIAKLLGTVDNKMEQEVYIEKIAKEYKISKEAIYAEVNKRQYAKSKGSKVLERPIERKTASGKQVTEENIPEAVIEKEQLIISLLLEETENLNHYNKIKENITPEDFKLEQNKKIVQKLYEVLEKGNSNINGTLDFFAEDEEIVNVITKIMAKDYGVKDKEKAITDILNTYEKEKLLQRKNEIIEALKQSDLKEKTTKLEEELQEIVIKLTQKM